MKKSNDKIEMYVGTDVFLDLGRSPAEAQDLNLRSDMLSALIDLIEKKKLSKAGAAKRLGVTQARIAELRKGNISVFSLPDLVEMIANADVAKIHTGSA